MQAGCGVWGVGRREQGETIDNLRVNHTIKNGFVISYQLSVITSLITLYCLLKKLATRQFPTTDRYVNISKVLPIKASYGLSHKDEV